jgi:signal transduction histidine kinase
MFERHWRGAGAQAGSGLGLALVRAVATRYGGDAAARPNADGLGLEVSFSLGPVLEWHEGSAEGR